MRQKQRNQDLLIVHQREPLRYHLPQQYICKGCRIYQQSSDEGLSLKHIISPSTDSESKQLRFQGPYRKFIHKQKHIVKHNLRPAHKHEDKFVTCVSIKRDVLHQRDSMPSRRKCCQMILDWMIEAASLLKVSKNACYRSLIIFFRICEFDSRIISSKFLSHYACGALSLGSKFESSEVDNYLESVFQINARRISKDNIKMAQYNILEVLDLHMKILKWKLPVNVDIESQITQLIESWNKYLMAVSSQFQDKFFYQKMTISSIEKGSNKCYIQVVYIIDYLVLKLHSQFLKKASFKVPVLMAIYMIASINLGDVHLNQKSAWPTFEKFLTVHNIASEEQNARLKIEIQKQFLELRIIEVLGKIPLNLNFDKLIKGKNEQFYIPKIENNF